ncbi:hypothetical protein MNL76_03910 [Fervidobacterium riparium]
MKTYYSRKSSHIILSFFVLLLIASSAFAGLTLQGLWNGGTYSRQVPNKFGPAVITKSQGNIIFLSKDGAAYELTIQGGLINYGQVSGAFNVVAPPTYIELGSDKYLVYVSAQAANNKIIVHELATGGNIEEEDLDGAAYGVVAYVNSSGEIEIITADMTGKIYKFVFDGSSISLVNSAYIALPIKAPPILNFDKSYFYIMTQSGKLYEAQNIVDGSFTLSSAPLENYGGSGKEFTVPMAMDESGYLYALRSDGTLFKIDPSTGEEEHASGFLSYSNSSGPLIDGEGNIFIFGDDGKVVALNSSLAKMGEYTVGQRITSTPAIIRGNDGVTYLIVPSSHQSLNAGKITILSYNSTTGNFEKVWDYTTNASIPISGAVNVAPTGALTNDYYFAVPANDGAVYAWKFNGSGPYGSWPVYGQNPYHTGFVDQSAMLFKTKIYLVALDGYYGQELSKTLLGSTTNYGILYDATILLNDGTEDATYVNLRTNSTNSGIVLEATPTSQARVTFATPTEAQLLLGRYVTPKGGSYPTRDATFTFKYWKVMPPDNYEGAEDDKPATLTFKFSNRTVKLYTNATYTFYIYHKYATDEATEENDVFFDYEQYINNPSSAQTTINASPNQGGETWFAYKWKIYQWNPTASSKYNYTEIINQDRDSVTLYRSGPAYIEIYYAQLNATLTLVVPEFAYGKTMAYMFLDVAPNSLAQLMNIKTKNGVTIDRVVSEEYDDSVLKIANLSKTSSTEVKIAMRSFENPPAVVTRVATIALYLMFPEQAMFQGTDPEQYEEYFDLYGYAQVSGQQVDPQYLRAKIVYSANKYLYLVGDFDNNYAVDINDWDMFATVLGSEVSGENIKYNIGPREGFNSPYPLTSYSAGYLTDETNLVDTDDLWYFVSMFGTVVPESDRIQ